MARWAVSLGNMYEKQEQEEEERMGVHEEEEEEEEEESRLIGVVEVMVVGLQYYRGTVSDGEMVCLIREPNNLYDSNAIRVENMRGEQVGHVERGKAMLLAPVVDRGLAVMEGVVSEIGSTRWKMPCHVHILGRSHNVQAVQSLLRDVGMHHGAAGMHHGPAEMHHGPANPRLSSQQAIFEAYNSWVSSSAWQQMEMCSYLSFAEEVIPRGRGAGRKRKRKAEVVEQKPQKKKADIDDIFEILSQCSNGGEGREVAIEASTVISSPLLQHQKEALGWLVKRENSSELPPFWEEVPSSKSKSQKSMFKNTITNFSCDQRPLPLRGGILADDMGMGKTLSLLALVVTNRAGSNVSMRAPPHHPSSESSPTGNQTSMEAGEDDEESLDPASIQYKLTMRLREKKRKTKVTNSTSRGKKQKNQESLETLTRPSTVVFDGPKATLVVCPVSVLSNWMTQVEEHTLPGSVSVHVYHGLDRMNTAEDMELDDYDMVLTTYQTLCSDGLGADAPLQRIKWLRIILDEAHVIKNPAAQQTKVVVALKAERKWVVTGTPIQNSAQDLLSFMMFLELQPLNDRSFWNRTIQRPLSKGDCSGLSRLQSLMTAISLRRTKETHVNGKRIIELPRKTVNIHQVHLLDEDRELYDKVEFEGRQTISRYVDQGTVLQNYTTVLQIILRLRQICDHSALCPDHAAAMVTNPDSATGDTVFSSPELLQKLLSVLQSGDEFDCPICLSPPSMAVITKCAHIYCRRCIEKSLARDKQLCPLCRSSLTASDLINAPVDEELEVPSTKRSSAKIDALIKLIVKEKERDPTVRSVVFSQFTQMLSHIEGPLKDAGIRYVRLDGSMTAKKRQQSLSAFASKDADAPLVFLLSLKAAGVGLNLVAASRVYMLDPWWNPAVEEQAMDRVHRLGQTRDVEVIRLIAADTVEERILQMQEKKRQLASFAFDKKSEERRQMLVGDVQLLMRL